VLRKVGVLGDDLGEQYNCPVAYYDDWKTVRYESADERYRICPRKLADACEYEEENIDNALRAFAEVGEGRTWSTERVRTLRQEVINISDEIIRNLPFKRDTSIGKIGGRSDSGEEDDEDGHYG